MLQVGDRVMYGTVEGEIVKVIGDMLIVRMQDGQEYPLTAEQVKRAPRDTESVMPGIMTALRPHLKKPEFLAEMAKEMSKAGVSELSILNGSISKFSAKESLEEIKAKKRAEALAKADADAETEFNKQNAA